MDEDGNAEKYSTRWITGALLFEVDLDFTSCTLD